MRLAATYPSNIIYAFKLSFERYRQRHPDTSIRPIVNDISQSLTNPLNEKFISGLKCLVLPKEQLQGLLETLYKQLGNELRFTNQIYQDEMKLIFETVFNDDMRAKQSLTNILKFKNEIKRLISMNGR